MLTCLRHVSYSTAQCTVCDTSIIVYNIYIILVSQTARLASQLQLQYWHSTRNVDVPASVAEAPHDGVLVRETRVPRGLWLHD
jgi:hypothetical protein